MKSTAVERPVRPWVPQPYYGTVFDGVTLGAVIAATAVPTSPSFDVCWYWSNSSQTRGYWDFCQQSERARFASRRVRIFAAEKGIELSLEEVDILAGQSPTPELLAKNSSGGVPLLELDDGSYLSQSVAICRYLEGLHPEPNLLGRDPREQVEIERWNRRMELELFAAIGRTVQNMAPAPRLELPEISPILKADTVRLHVSREKDGKLHLVDAGWDDAKVASSQGDGRVDPTPGRGSDDPPFKNQAPLRPPWFFQLGRAAHVHRTVNFSPSLLRSRYA